MAGRGCYAVNYRLYWSILPDVPPTLVLKGKLVIGYRAIAAFCGRCRRFAGSTVVSMHFMCVESDAAGVQL